MTNRDRQWIEGHFDKLRDLIVEVQVDIAALKVKAGIWGLIGGLIPVLVTLAIYIFIKGN